LDAEGPGATKSLPTSRLEFKRFTMNWGRLALIMPLFVGCATQPLNTTSGRPEVTIHNTSAAKVRSIAVNHFVDLGWEPVNAEGNQLVFEHEGSLGQSFAMGLLTDNPQSKQRITITIIQNGSDLRLIAGVAILGQTNFGRQQVVELRGKGYQQVQSILEHIKQRAE
jgi:hypothetical protein